jgi:ribonuclease D
MISLVESYNAVSNWMDTHKSDKINEGKTPDELISEFEEKLKNNLNESEMSFVQQITDWRSPIAEQRKEKLFNKFKNECIDKINEMLKEDAENVELKGLSDQINEMSFNKETIVKDIAKLLEIRDILMDD